MSIKYKFQKDLTERQRRTRANRLFRLRDLIADLSPEQYRHDEYISRMGGGCGTVACALGHAVVNKHKLFRKLDLSVKRTRGGSCHLAGNYEYFGEEFAAEEYFGRGSFSAIFDVDAFAQGLEGNVPLHNVVRRINKFVRESFGYSAPA